MSNKKYEVGVIVGRFQVARLTVAHASLIFKVMSMCDEVVIALGVPGTNPTIRDPLDYSSRKIMIQSEFPSAIIFPVYDNPSDEIWSQKLDEDIHNAVLAEKICLFGGRDSFIPRYSGKYPTEILHIGHSSSGTEHRSVVSSSPLDTEDKRIGAIYSTSNRYSISYQAVDIAVIRTEGDEQRVLMGVKTLGGGYKFPGGFVDPEDHSLEFAAIRELGEEVYVDVHSDEISYVTSNRQKDFRYSDKSGDSLMTALYKVPYLAGPGRPKTEFIDTEWILCSNWALSVVDPSHKELFIRLLKNLGVNK